MILFAHSAATLYMTGLIWFVQLVHYPLHGHVGADAFLEYQAHHVQWTGLAVGPAMLIEAIGALLLVVSPPFEIPNWQLWLGLALVSFGQALHFCRCHCTTACSTAFGLGGTPTACWNKLDSNHCMVCPCSSHSCHTVAAFGETIVIAPVPELRITSLNDHQLNTDGEFVVYWMVSHRRVRWNYSLQHAISIAQAHQKPLIILEALRVGYRWASHRTHQFIIEGMQDNQACVNKARPFITHTSNLKRVMERVCWKPCLREAYVWSLTSSPASLFQECRRLLHLD